MGFLDMFVDTEKLKGNDDSNVVETPQKSIKDAVVTATVSGPDDKYVSLLYKSLEDIMDADNDSDLLTFIKAAQKTAKLVPDEATRFKVSAENLGVDTNAIVQSGSRYFDKLKKEKAEFQESQKSLEDSEISALVEKSKILETDVRDAREEIVKLNNLIQTNTAEISKISENLASARVKLANRQAQFDASFASVENSLKSDIEKIKIYLGGESK